jgi:hypothetical protein
MIFYKTKMLRMPKCCKECARYWGLNTCVTDSGSLSLLKVKISEERHKKCPLIELIDKNGVLYNVQTIINDKT